MLPGDKELFKILLLMSSRIRTFIQALHGNEEQQQSVDDINDMERRTGQK